MLFFLFGQNNTFEQFIFKKYTFCTIPKHARHNKDIILSNVISKYETICRNNETRCIKKHSKNLHVKFQNGGRHHGNHDKQQRFIKYLTMQACLVTIILEFMKKKTSPINKVPPFIKLRNWPRFYFDYT